MARKDKKVGVFLFSGIAAAMVVAIASLLYMSPPAVDSMGCSKDEHRSHAHVAILLDSTEPYGINQVKHVSNHIYKTLERLKPMDRISVFQINSSLPSKIELTFKSCVPRESIQDAPVFQALKKARFKKGIETALIELQGNQKSSPIINALSGVAAVFKDINEPKTILLVSDLIEHSDIISMYSQKWLSDANQEAERLDKNRPMLDGVEIDIVFMHRPFQKQQNFDLRNWWLEYLDRSGAFINQVKNISAG